MNLRIVPSIPSQPTVIFSLNWHAPPPSLSLPHHYSTQLVACQDARIPVPRNPLAVDKAVGLHLLIDSVTFDLSRQLVSVAWIDGQSLEWTIDEVEGFRAALEDVLDCVKMSGVEAEKEKKAVAAALAAKTNPGHSRSESLPEASTSTPPVSGHRRHRTASGIFSSLVATFITPPSSPPTANKDSTTTVPEHLAGMYRPRNSSQIYHAQHISHPSNKRETLPTQPVAQSRYLRRQARAKLVDIFRCYVATRITKKLRAAGIVGDELRERGILDDMDMECEETGPMEGTGGFAAAGGYVAYMARSMLKNALAEAAKKEKEEEDEWSSSGDESLLLTPKDGDNQLSADVPEDYVSVQKKKSSTSRKTPAHRRTSSAPQTHQIRHLSSLLIGLTQKDKRTTSDEREVLEMVKERSLRRKWSLSETSPSPASPRIQHRRSRSESDIVNARMNPQANGWMKGVCGKPLVGSPLRSVEAVDYFEVPFPKSAPVSTVPMPIDEDASDVTDAIDAIPIIRDDVSVLVTKAFEAEDVNNNGRIRRESLKPTSPSSTSSSPSSETDVISTVSEPVTPTKQRGSHSRSASCPSSLTLTFSSSSSSSDSDEEMEITDASDEDEAYSLTIPAPAPPTGTIQTIYATMPKSPVSASPTSPTFQKLAEDEQMMVRGLELELENGASHSMSSGRPSTEGGINGSYWPHLHDGIYVV